MTCSEFLQSEVTYSRCPTPSGSSEVPIHNAPASVSWWAKRQVSQRWGKGAKIAKKMLIFHNSGQISSRPHTTEKPPKWWLSKGSPLKVGEILFHLAR